MVQKEDAGGSIEPIQQEPLQQAEHLFWDSKFPEALENLTQLESQEALSELTQLQSQLLKCRILAQLDIKKALDVAIQVIKTSQDLDLPLIQVDALLVMAETLQYLGKLKDSQTFLEQGKAVLATISSITASDLTAREATVLALEGGIYTFACWSLGTPERALECIKQSLRLLEQRSKPQGIPLSLTYLVQMKLYLHKGEIERAEEYLQQSLTIREQLQQPLEIAHSCLWLGWAYSQQRGDENRSLEFYQQSLAIYEQLGNQYGMALALSCVGMNIISKGELERALEVLRNSLAICEQLGISDTFAESNYFMQLGRIYRIKGELEDALEYFQNALAIEETRGAKKCIGWVLKELGITHIKKGQLEVAFEYLVKGLKIHEDPAWIATSLFHLVSISLELGQLETARRYMHRLKAHRAKVAIKYVDQTYNLARALLLKASPRTRDKMHAQMLFQQLAEEGIWFDITVPATLNLCELLFFEFKTSEDPEILHEIQTSMNHLHDQAMVQQNHSLLAETYLLQAKLALLDLDVTRAQYLLTEAQAIAEEKGLQLLTRSISDEYDTLLRQINQWKALQAQKTSPDEISELTDLKAHVVRMIRKQLNEVSDNLLKEITTSFQIPNALISKNDRIIHKYPTFKYDTISTAIISCLKRKKRLNISQLTKEVRIQRGRASRRIIRERVNYLINQGILEEVDEGNGRQLRVIPLSDDIEIL